MKKYVKLIAIAFSLILTVNMTIEPVIAADASTAQQTESTVEDIQNSEIESKDGQILGGSEDGEISEEEIVTPEESENIQTTAETSEIIKDLKAVKNEQGNAQISWTISKQGFSGWYFVAVYSDKKMKNLVQNVVKIEDFTQTSYVLERLEKDTFYYVKVTPYELQDRTEVAGDAISGPVYLFGTNPSNLTAKAGDAQVELKWTGVDGADGYEVYCANTGDIVGTTTETSYTHSDLKNNVAYTYKVRAYIDNGTTECVSDWSEQVVSAKTKIVTPGKVSDLKIAAYNKGAKLSWSKVSGATSYYVYRYNSKTESWDRIRHQTANSYTDTGLTVDKKYYYRVAAVRTSGGVTAVGANSDSVSITAKVYLTGEVRPMYYRGTLKRSAKAYVSVSGTEYTKMLAKGTKVTVLEKKSKRCKVQLSNGQVCWVGRGHIIWQSCIYTSNDYTAEDKLDFVNKNGYSSPTKYLIWISQYTQRVNIYQGSKGNWKLIRTCRVATGTHITQTPRGVFKITYKEKGWYYTNTCVHKIVHFAGRNSLHSRIYYYNGKLSSATIGRPASHGCVRMYMEDITYIYNNMPKGTTVVSY